MKIDIHIVLLLASSLLVGCTYDGSPESPTQTPLHDAEKIVETFNFGLPSVDLFRENDTGDGYTFFFLGKKGNPYPAGSGPFFAEARVCNLRSAFPPRDGSISEVRKWSVVYDTFSGVYDLRSGPYEIDFRYDKKSRPTIATLRKTFGRWIIFSGDDMSRVHEFDRGQGWRILVFNDGRAPADTMLDDVKRQY